MRDLRHYGFEPSCPFWDIRWVYRIPRWIRGWLIIQKFVSSALAIFLFALSILDSDFSICQQRATCDVAKIQPIMMGRQHQRLKWCESYLTSDIACDISLEIELMIIALATGILDATTFPEYFVFASNQTGNTALLAIGALSIGRGIVDLRHVGLSLGAFVAGGLICGQTGNKIGRMSRLWLLITNVLQTVLVFAAAIINTRRIEAQSSAADLGIIALLAFASGAQVASARTVHVPEVPTAMVTSAYVDFLVDPSILTLHNRARNRRLCFVATLLLGSFLGAIAYRYYSPALALYLSATIKALVCIALLFNPQNVQRSMDQSSQQGV